MQLMNIMQLRSTLRDWMSGAKKVLLNLANYLKQERERCYQQKLREMHYRIGELLVNLHNWQRTGIAKAIRVLDEIVAKGGETCALRDRQIELALCHIADIITHKNSLFSLRPIQGAYQWLSEFQECLIWQFVARFKYRFKAIQNSKSSIQNDEPGSRQNSEPVREAVADLDATLDIDEPSTLREEAIDWAIDKAGEAIQRWMPHLFPPSLVRGWEEWEASVWRAITCFKQRFGTELANLV